MTTFACTPRSVRFIRERGQQNIGYGSLMQLMITNRKNMFDSHRLWVKEGRNWRHIASFNKTGWTSELTAEVRGWLEEEIATASLATYLEWIGGNISQDLDHWASMGITTAKQLGDYLDGCVAREAQK